MTATASTLQGSTPARLEARRDGPDLVVELTGDWLLGTDLPSHEPALEAFRSNDAPERVGFEAQGLGAWDTGLVTTLVALHRNAQARNIAVDDAALPEGARRLVALAFAVKERTDAHRGGDAPGFVEQVGAKALELWRSTVELIDFLGRIVAGFGRMLRGRATYRRQHVFVYVQEAGPEALPIVALISLLIGMIFAFVGVSQLERFGAGIFTADLVAIAMVREIAAIITAIIMAGRTGAAYAGEIGTMKVNEEVDALTTLGIDPIDYLVLPRIIALVLMMPLLTLFSSLLGILGGLLVGLLMLDVTLPQYVEQTLQSAHLNDVFGGLFKSLVYGSLVAIAGCMQGMACGNSAMAVGIATTKAVVMGIVLIVVSASLLTIVYISLGI